MKVFKVLKSYVAIVLVAGFSTTATLAQENLSVFDYWKFHEGTPLDVAVRTRLGTAG